jgi:hypothetical protein
VCVRGACSAAAVIVGLISGLAELVPQRHQQCWRARGIGKSFAPNTGAFAHAPAIQRPDPWSEADRCAVAP